MKRDSRSVNVLEIDELNTPLSGVSRARSALTTYLERHPSTLPVPTLFVASGASRLDVLKDFTQDREALLAALKAHVSDVDFRALANQLAGGGEDRIWPPELGATSGRQRADKSFADLLRRAETRDFRFHNLGHTFASWHMMCGGDLYELSKLIGRSNIKMAPLCQTRSEALSEYESVSREVRSKLEP